MKTSLINRRQFVQLITAASASWPLINHAQTASSHQILGLGAELVYINLQEPWLSIAEVQEHLFPADDSSPGAKDISALRFIRNILETPDVDTEEKDFIIKGVGWLNDLSKKEFKQSFINLSSDDKESVLRNIETSRAGSRWLSIMMTYLIEALLSDPVYGGNKDKKGWQWLEHKAGFPTPTSNQVYFKLANQAKRNTRRRTKA